MKTRLLFFLFAVTNAIATFSQTNHNDVQIMEGEVRAGITTPLGGYHTGKSQASATLGIEGRYNFKGTPWDCGLMLDLSAARRDYKHLFNEGNSHWQSNRTLALALTGDYNFLQGKKVNPFIGAGIGVAFNDVVGDEYFPSKGTSMFFAPRVGVEIFYHCRISTQCNLSKKGHNNLSITLGLIIGGRPKKQK